MRARLKELRVSISWKHGVFSTGSMLYCDSILPRRKKISEPCSTAGKRCLLATSLPMVDRSRAKALSGPAEELPRSLKFVLQSACVLSLILGAPYPLRQCTSARSFSSHVVGTFAAPDRSRIVGLEPAVSLLSLALSALPRSFTRSWRAIERVEAT